MQAIQGYYDGAGIRLLEKVHAKPNQRAIVTIMDEFVTPEKTVVQQNLRGALAQYASAERRAQEEGAWARVASPITAGSPPRIPPTTL